MIGNSEGEGGGGVEKPKESMKLEFDSFFLGGGKFQAKKLLWEGMDSSL